MMDLKEDIELRNNLSNLYLRAERLMSMRSTSSESVRLKYSRLLQDGP